MADLPLTSRAKLNVGVRGEFTNIFVRSRDITLRAGEINKLDILPGLNFVYEVAENMNLRLSYSRTIARPTFREMAPFASYDFNQDNILVGNPNLDRTLVDNADIRYEYFFKPGEMVSVSLFYKNLQNPIEKVFNPEASNDEITFRNVPNAVVYGAELEFRKKLGFIHPGLDNFNVGGNLSYIVSRVDIDSLELSRFRAVLGSDYPAQRRLFAQSPYIINTFFGYLNPETGTEANVNFNVFGPRLSLVGNGTSPDVMERPRPALNFMFSQQFGTGKRFKVTLRANNLLNPLYNFAYTVEGQQYAFQQFRLGRDFSVGLSYTIR
jgi:TonB-dependent receptor